MPAAAQAEAPKTYAFAGGTLSVTLTTAGTVNLGCSAGNVADGGTSIDGGSGTIACSSVSTLNVDGSSGDDSIDLSGVTSSANGFPASMTVLVDGHDGNDNIVGSGYGDRLVGGKGIDTLSGGPGDDTLDPQLGSDSLIGGTGTDTAHEDLTVQGGVFLYAGTDPADPTQSDVQVPGSPNPSSPERDHLSNVERLTVVGSPNGDGISGSGCACVGGPFQGDMIVNGGAGNDTIVGADGNDTINGAGGLDTLTGGGGNDTVEGGGDGSLDAYSAFLKQPGTLILSNDVQTPGRAMMTGTLGTDTLIGFDQIQMQGSSGNDILDATAYDRKAILQGEGGDDKLYGGPGDDSLNGGTGNDTMLGGAGDDDLSETAGDGNDVMEGGAGNDDLIDTVGDDTLTGGPGDDYLDGGTGNDVALATGSQLTLAKRWLTGDAGTDRLWNASIETVILTGTPGADTLSADGPAADGGPFNKIVQINGLGGDDHLTPGSAISTLDGGAGTDRLDLVGDTHPTVSDASLMTATHGTSTIASVEETSLTGTSGADTLDASAFSGPATLTGLAGHDTLLGGAGDDTLSGGTGASNVVDGGISGTDTLVEPPPPRRSTGSPGQPAPRTTASRASSARS